MAGHLTMKAKTQLYLAGGALFLIGAYYTGKKAKAAAADVLESINPASTENVVYRFVNHIGASVTGDPNWNLGVEIYDLLHGDDEPVAGDSYNWLDGNNGEWPGI